MNKFLVWIALAIGVLLFVLMVAEFRRAALVLMWPIIILAFGIWLLATGYKAYKDFNKENK